MSKLPHVTQHEGVVPHTTPGMLLCLPQAAKHRDYRLEAGSFRHCLVTQQRPWGRGRERGGASAGRWLWGWLEGRTNKTRLIFLRHQLFHKPPTVCKPIACGSRLVKLNLQCGLNARLHNEHCRLTIGHCVTSGARRYRTVRSKAAGHARRTRNCSIRRHRHRRHGRYVMPPLLARETILQKVLFVPRKQMHARLHACLASRDNSFLCMLHDAGQQI